MCRTAGGPAGRDYREVGIKTGVRVAADAPWDSGDLVEPHRPSLGPKPTIVVASPVAIGEIESRRARLKVLSDRTGLTPLCLSYHPRLALIESIFVRDFYEEELASDYRRLVG